MCTGRLVKLAAKSAELQTDEPVAALSNLKLHLIHPQSEVVPDKKTRQSRRQYDPQEQLQSARSIVPAGLQERSLQTFYG